MEFTKELIAGLLTILGIVVLILNKFGLVSFGKGKKVELIECPSHRNVVTLLTRIEKQQIANTKAHEAHERRLKEGKNQFVKFQESIDYFNKAVAVLLDRSGGIPKGLENNKRIKG